MLLSLCAIGVSLLQVQSCIKPPRDFDPRDGNNVYTACRIKSMGGAPWVYNENNDPVSSVHTNAGTGSPNIFFKYDNKGRLMEYTGLDDNGSYEFMHRYTYHQQRIVIDTMYIFGQYGVPNSALFKRIYYPRYDNLNRIAQDSLVYYSTANGPAANSVIIDYPYHQDGNLFNGYTYDNKLNFHRTNKIWMFIDREYSLNNPVPALTYNSAGLPLTFSSKNLFDFNFTYFSVGGAITISYDCK